jgi:hypothetical protein
VREFWARELEAQGGAGVATGLWVSIRFERLLSGSQSCRDFADTVVGYDRLKEGMQQTCRGIDNRGKPPRN